jgi:hypothetical protein
MMSEPGEQEELTEPTVVDVPELDQPSDDETAEEEAHEAEQVEQEPAEAAQPTVDAAKEQRRLAGALKREQEAHDKKLEKILGEAHEHVLACPLCGDGLQGYVFPGDGPNLPEEQKVAALAFLQVEGPGTLNQAQGFHECETCNGYGELANPTKVPHYLTRTCPDCQGNGFRADVQPQSNVAQLPATAQPSNPSYGGEVGACPLCGAPNSAGRPHFCNPVAQAAT